MTDSPLRGTSAGAVQNLSPVCDKKPHGGVNVALGPSWTVREETWKTLSLYDLSVNTLHAADAQHGTGKRRSFWWADKLCLSSATCRDLTHSGSAKKQKDTQKQMGWRTRRKLDASKSVDAKSGTCHERDKTDGFLVFGFFLAFHLFFYFSFKK